MKKIFSLIVILLQVSFLSAQERDNVGHRVGSWNISSHDCFKGLNWKIRKSYYSDNSDKYTNEIEIKNNYGSTITFSYNMSENANETTTRYRKTLTPGQTYSSTYCPNVNLVSFYVSDVCFNNTNCKDGCYAECDNGSPNQPNCNNTSTIKEQNANNSSQGNDLTEYNKGKADIDRQIQEANQKITDRNAEALRQQELQRQEQLRLQQEQKAQRTEAYVNLGVEVVKGTSDLIKAFKEDKLAKIEKAKQEAEQKAADEEMERQWVIAQNHADEKSTDGYVNAIQIMLPYAKADRLNGMALNTIGYWYYVMKDYSNAVKWYNEAATKSDKQAMYNLGVVYEHGQGVSKNIPTSIDWFKQACLIDYKNELGACKQVMRLEMDIANSYTALNTIDGYRKAIEIIKPYVYKSDIIDGPALNELGVCYVRIKDYKEGKGWLEEAVRKFGNAKAMGNLGVIYEDGLGIPKNNDEAAMWYKRACNLGQASACKNLEHINKVMIDGQNKIASLIPVETTKELDPSITVQSIIDKNVLAIGGLEKINSVKTLTEIYGNSEGGTTKTITANGIWYYEANNSYGTHSSLSNGLEGYEVVNGKKTKLKKDKNYIKDFKPMRHIILSGKDYKLGKIETIEGVEHYTFIYTSNTQEYSSSSTFYYNAETGLLKCRKSTYDNPTAKMNNTSYTYYDDYRAVEGILFPFTESEVTINNDKTSKKIKTYKKIAINDINEEPNLK